MSGDQHAVVVGAGIVGLATARALTRRGVRVTVLDKEHDVAAHQTGRNSGVIHSGLYYKPDSLKARLGTAGAASMLAFAREHGVAVEQCGKLVVATREEQRPALAELLRRGTANGVPCHAIGPEEAREHEPEVSCVAALWVETTGIVDYVGVSRVMADQVVAGGGEIRFGAEVTAVHDGRVRLADGDQVAFDLLVNCAGLHSDRIARLAGAEPDVRIVPFRGEYFELAPAYTHLVRGLIYPVPDPTLPFLGVHLTRLVQGGVHAGPNAVLALAREGYRWRDVVPRDVWDSASWPGLWRLARRYWRTGVEEVARSASQRRFARSLRELVPAVPDEALVPSHAGVRAQALRRDGSLVDDFLLLRRPGQLHVLNAPSPAATASLEIGDRVAGELLEDRDA
ncbi:L-2-hydroxyglutarate oxidase [Nocardioides mangrovicus]|uniref:L-2-hydroxyglutarate oxidase n=1 Tax=Nocardioides mangrovicus TaxID=2478913 RepID=A0A3L8P7P5_9ACTN|nr:L-2-hydroxyglutarate oxidase [Nocardioides mangrovicus]RLV50977.1 L-2-hydroxyglutarate oxidase [Nocardioides mangrovicus]